MFLWVFALLTACQTIGDSTAPITDGQAVTVNSEQQTAELLESQANYRGAADKWLSLANNSVNTQRDEYLLRAVSALLQIQDTQQAEQLLNFVSQTTTPAWIINTANLQILLNKPIDALNLLISLPTETLNRNLQKQNLNLQAKAYSRLGNHLEAAQQRIKLDALLDDALSQDSNHAALWSDLNKLSIAALSRIHSVTSPGNYRDWLELAILNKQAKQIGGTVQLDEWKRRHPLHPAVSRFLDTLRNIELSTTPAPAQVALLLPLSGRIAEPARAVRDGFLAAYYRNQNNTSVRLYDADASNITTVYEQAVRDGADFIVGPLSKDAVKQLSNKTNFTVPTLVLNANEENAERHSRLYQFALLPEDEARQVAERIWLEGHSKGIIIYPESNWGERVGKAFQQRWQHLGGELVDIQSYSLKSRDYAKPIREVLHVNKSKKRFRQLRNVIGGKLEFETRRRQDIDFIFLASFSEQARQIRPQLKFYDASKIPVYATSHVYTGMLDPQRDRDMNGIIFSDMPWTIENAEPKLKANLSSLWQSRTKKLTRFYAFGFDAYSVIPHLQRLQQYPFERYKGLTGSLRIDENLRIVRQLSWAKFRLGKPRLEPLNTEPTLLKPVEQKPIESGFPKPNT